MNRRLIWQGYKKKHLIGFFILAKNERLPLQAAFHSNDWLLMD
jgi:hypothetical protein